MNKQIVINEETFIESIITDIVTFGFLILTLFLNHKYFGGSFLITAFIFIGLFVGLNKWAGKRVKRMSKKEAFEYLIKQEQTDE